MLQRCHKPFDVNRDLEIILSRRDSFWSHIKVILTDFFYNVRHECHRRSGIELPCPARHKTPEPV